MKDFLARFVPHPEASLTLAEAQEKFLHNRLIGGGFAEKTRRNYQIDVGQLCEYLRTSCGVTTVQPVQLRHLEGYLDRLERQGLTSATRRRKVAAIRSFSASCRRTATGPATRRRTCGHRSESTGTRGT